MSLDHRSLAELVNCCQAERSAFRSTGERHSPCCMALFRRACAGDQDAWTEIVSIFQRLLCDWVNKVNHQLDDHELQTAIHDAWLGLYKGCTKNPSLTATDNLAPLLKYLQQCAKRAVLQERRKEAKQPYEAALDQALPAAYFSVPDPAFAFELLAYLDRFITEEPDRLLFDRVFLQGFKPAEIVQLRPDLFPDEKAVYQRLQTLRRRLRRDPNFRRLCGLDSRDEGQGDDSATSGDESDPSSSRSPGRKPDDPSFLEARMDDGSEGDERMQTPCDLDDETLLDYVEGLLSDAQRALVEANPACVARARRLAAEIALIEARLYRSTCPDVDTLLAYHERELESTQALVVHQHVSQCRRCREELDLLQAMDAVPFDEPAPANPLRRLVQAVLIPPLALKLRGDAPIYTTQEELIALSSARKAPGAPRWNIHGEVSLPDGMPLPQPIEQVFVTRDNAPPVVGEIDEDGSFAVRDLPPGLYRLTIVLPEKEIVIDPIQLGEEV